MDIRIQNMTPPLFTPLEANWRYSNQILDKKLSSDPQASKIEAIALVIAVLVTGIFETIKNIALIFPINCGIVLLNTIYEPHKPAFKT